MTPALSHRIARAINALPWDALTIEQRFEIGPASEPADTFDDLPEWVRTLVEAGEHTLTRRT